MQALHDAADERVQPVEHRLLADPGEDDAPAIGELPLAAAGSRPLVISSVSTATWPHSMRCSR